MFDDLFAEVDAALASIVESDVFQIGIRVLVAYVVLIWLASAFWAYRDMRLRSASAITPYVAAAAIIVFTPIFFLFGLLLYRIVRPKETIAEVNERTLAEETMLAEVASHAHCANCSRPVHEEWIICPTCRNRLRRVCPNCERLIELDWSLCAWCGKDFERADAPGLTAYMPSARPTPRPTQVPVRMPTAAATTAAWTSTTSVAPSASAASTARPPASGYGYGPSAPSPRSSGATSGGAGGSMPSSAGTTPAQGAQAPSGASPTGI
jgi:RNA polymerase subunit RPABC4/transcription elongation factor Spt4